MRAAAPARPRPVSLNRHRYADGPCFFVKAARAMQKTRKEGAHCKAERLAALLGQEHLMMLAMSLAIPALAAPLLLAERPAAASKSDLYLDILSPEVVGELRSQSYDTYRGSDKSQFVGKTEVARGTLIGGGIGLRLAYALPYGLRLSGEGSYTGGQLFGAELPWGQLSTMQRGEMLGGLGYQLAAGPVVLHAAAILGCDYASFKVAQPLTVSMASSLGTTGAAAAAGGTLQDPLSDSGYQLERWSLRLGAQVGLHLQLSKMTALYSDVTFDYDGQWRTRFGFAVGSASHRSVSR